MLTQIKKQSIIKMPKNTLFKTKLQTHKFQFKHKFMKGLESHMEILK